MKWSFKSHKRLLSFFRKRDSLPDKSQDFKAKSKAGLPNKTEWLNLKDKWTFLAFAQMLFSLFFLCTVSYDCFYHTGINI